MFQQDALEEEMVRHTAVPKNPNKIIQTLIKLMMGSGNFDKWAFGVPDFTS